MREHADSRCPHCGATVNAVASLTGNREAKVGDLTICSYCGTPARYGKGMKMIPLSKTELKAAMSDWRIGLAIKAIKVMNKERGG